MRPVTMGRGLLAIGALGVVLSLVGIVVGLRLLGSVDTAVRDSIELTAEALDTVDASVEVTDEAVSALAGALDRSGQTMEQVTSGLGDAVEVLEATATLTEDELAGSLAAVEGTLPALIDVAAVIDRTLSALSVVPFGPDYDPAEPFDDSLRAVQQELDGLPQALRDQAELVRDASASLADVQDGAGAISAEIGGLEQALRGASGLLADYAETASSARDVVDRGAGDLDRDLRLARVLVVALGLTLAAANLAPLAVGWLLLHPEAWLPPTA